MRATCSVCGKSLPWLQHCEPSGCFIFQLSLPAQMPCVVFLFVMWLFSCQGFRAHVAVTLFPSMVHGATWLQSDHVVQMHFLPAATLSTPVRSPSPTVCLSASSHAHEEASCHSGEASCQWDHGHCHCPCPARGGPGPTIAAVDIMVQCQNPKKPCGSWVFMRKVANRATCQLCNFPWRNSLQMGGTILHEDWLELQLQKARAATKSKPAAKGPTTKGHGKSTMAMSKPKAKTKK